MDLYQNIHAQRKQLAMAAQDAYDNWHPTGGRIDGGCHLIAMAFRKVLREINIDDTEIFILDIEPQKQDDIPHTLCFAENNDEVYTIDIPWYKYETATVIEVYNGFNIYGWNKVSEVRFKPEDILITQDKIK